ncbi:MAG: hypothetical protein U0350_11310 [Caldilineaceae bacterium]
MRELMPRNFLILMCLGVIGIAMFFLVKSPKHNVAVADSGSNIVSSPTIDVSQGAWIDVRAPNDIQQWVNEIGNMILIQNFAYISTENYGLQILNLSDPTHPKGVASVYFHTNVFQRYIPGSFFWTGKQLYVGAGCTGGMLFILELAQPAVPTLLDAHYLTCEGMMYVAENKAYIANHYSGLLVLDVSNPADIKEYGSVGVSDLLSMEFGYRQGIPPVFLLAVYKDVALVTVWGFQPTVLRLNTSNPSKLVVVDKISGSSSSFRYDPNYAQYGDTVYSSTQDGIFSRKIEFGSSDITLLPSSQYSLTASSVIPNLFVTQNRLYLVSPEIGLRVYDISNKNTIKWIGRYQPLSAEITQVQVRNDEIALVAGAHIFQIVDVKEKNHYKLLFSAP